MRHHPWQWLAALGVLAAAAAPAAAQHRAYRPTVSPYLELTRRSGNAATNYYNLVRPQFAFGNAILNLNQRVNTNQQAITETQAAVALPTTGHPVGFQTQRRFFQTLGAGSGPGTPAAKGVRLTPRPGP